MKKRMLSLALVFSFLLALCPLPVALAADLSGAEVTVLGGSFVYNGKAQEPNVTVSLDGMVLNEEADYTLSYGNNVNAGEGRVTVTGTGNYGGTAGATFTIEPYTLTAKHLEGQDVCKKTFDERAKAYPEIKASANGETVKVDYNKALYSQKGAGAASVTVSGLKLPAGCENYVLEEGLTELVLDGQILPQQTKVNNGTVEVGQTLDLWTLVENAGVVGSDGGPTASFDIIEPADKLGCAEPSPEHVFTAGSKPGVLTLSASISESYWDEDETPDYTGVVAETFTITITEPKQEETPPASPPEPSVPTPIPPSVTQNQPQEKLVITGAKDITYGQTLQLSCKGGSTNGAVTWGIAAFAASGQADISPAGLLTPTKAGTVWVTATMAGNDTYQDVTADAVKLTIRQAPIRITVSNKTAQMGDPVPALTTSDYSVSGLVGRDKLATLPTLSYETTPDMTRAGTVAILASGAAVPAGGNYDPNITYLPGKLTIGAAYPITILAAEGGVVTADAAQAPEGAVVTLTAQPEKGFVLDSLKVESGSTVIQTREAGKGKVTFTMPDGGVLVTPTFVTKELPFTDVKTQDWFYESVAYVYENGLMNGTSDTAFTPNGTTTRGMIVTILYRLAGSPEAAAWSPFHDVAPGKYYAEPIAWAAWNGIVNGKTATSFGPNDPITREQMAAILYRYAGFREMDVSQRGDLTQFGDQEKVSSYAREALAWANGAGLITGKGGGVLDPKGPATRAQVAAIFQRFCEGTNQ